ncbi:mgpp2cl-1, protein phosphatase 2C-like protein 1 [Balamuthia mandrillaris]
MEKKDKKATTKEGKSPRRSELSATAESSSDAKKKKKSPRKKEKGGSETAAAVGDTSGEYRSPRSPSSSTAQQQQPATQTQRANDSDESEEETEESRAELLAQLRATVQLDVSRQELTLAKLPPEMYYMTNLEMLSMSHNQLEDLPKNFGKLNKMFALGLNNNLLQHLPKALGHLPNLSILDLRSNRLVDLNPSTVKKMTALTKLMLRYNRIASLPPEIGHLKKLQLLSVRYNHLIKVPAEINKLEALQVFDARGNQLKTIPPMGALSALLELDLQHNCLSGLPDDLRRLSSLTRLSLGYNNFAAFPDQVTDMASLRELDLEQNRITNVPKSIKKMSALRTLYLSNNLISDIPSELGELADLEKLYLKNNKLSSVPDVLKKLRKLVELDLEKNPMDLGNSKKWTEAKKGNKGASTRPVLSDFFAAEELNKAGLIKAKKDPAQQEDAHCVHYPFFNDKDCALFCVFDGHAGKDASLAATRLFPEEFRKQLKQRKKEEKKKAAITDHTETFHLSFLRVDDQMAEFQYEGTTATAVFLWKADGQRYAQAANVGDSSAFLCRKGKAVAMTTEHKLTNTYERGRIISAGVWLNEGQTRISGVGVTRVLGDHFAKDTNSGMLGAPYSSEPFLLGEEDTHIVLASDGLWDFCSPQYVMDLIKKEPTAEAMAKRLIKASLSKSQDNITVVVICL